MISKKGPGMMGQMQQGGATLEGRNGDANVTGAPHQVQSTEFDACVFAEVLAKRLQGRVAPVDVPVNDECLGFAE